MGYSQRSMSGPLNETPKQTARNTLFQCPLTFLSASFPFLSFLPVTEIPPQKCKCCWRQTGTSNYYPCSQAVCHSPLVLSTSSGKEVDTDPNKSVEHCSVTLGETGASVGSSLCLQTHLCPALMVSWDLPSGWLDLHKFSISHERPLSFVLSRFPFSCSWQVGVGQAH